MLGLPANPRSHPSRCTSLALRRDLVALQALCPVTLCAFRGLQSAGWLRPANGRRTRYPSLRNSIPAGEHRRRFFNLHYDIRHRRLYLLKVKRIVHWSRTIPPSAHITPPIKVDDRVESKSTEYTSCFWLDRRCSNKHVSLVKLTNA